MTQSLTLKQAEAILSNPFSNRLSPKFEQAVKRIEQEMRKHVITNSK